MLGQHSVTLMKQVRGNFDHMHVFDIVRQLSAETPGRQKHGEALLDGKQRVTGGSHVNSIPTLASSHISASKASAARITQRSKT